MARSVWPVSGMVVAVMLMGTQLSQAAPPPSETRTFTIRVDDKPAGHYHMSIRQSGDTTTMSALADVKIKYVLVSYVYTYRGTEVWTGNRLTRFDSSAMEDKPVVGKKQFTLAAWADGNSLKVRANAQERTTRGDAWPTTYWRLPAPNVRNQALILLDADSGKDVNGTLQFMGNEQITVVGQQMRAAHWRVTGAVLVDLWYDNNERLVRQESLEDGHKTLLELTRVGP